MDIDNKRRSPRLRYRAYGSITNGVDTWPAHILNLSLHGALIGVICEHTLEASSSISLKIEMVDGGIMLLHGTVAHVKEHYVGLQCEPKGKKGKERLLDALK